MNDFYDSTNAFYDRVKGHTAEGPLDDPGIRGRALSYNL